MGRGLFFNIRLMVGEKYTPWVGGACSMVVNSLRCNLFVIKVGISSSICLFNIHYLGVAKLPKKSE